MVQKRFAATAEIQDKHSSNEEAKPVKKYPENGLKFGNLW